MLTAAWVLAGATTLLALTSFVAVITWREGSRRAREDDMTAKILEAARKEFSGKKEFGDLKDNLFGLGILAVIIGFIAWLARAGDGK